MNQVPSYRGHAEFHQVGLEHGLQQEVGDELERKNECLKTCLFQEIDFFLTLSTNVVITRLVSHLLQSSSDNLWYRCINFIVNIASSSYLSLHVAI